VIFLFLPPPSFLNCCWLNAIGFPDSISFIPLFIVFVFAAHLELVKAHQIFQVIFYHLPFRKDNKQIPNRQLIS